MILIVARQLALPVKPRDSDSLPEIVDKATAKEAFPRYERLFFLLLGIDEFLMLRRTPTGWTAPVGGIR